MIVLRNYRNCLLTNLLNSSSDKAKGLKSLDTEEGAAGLVELAARLLSFSLSSSTFGFGGTTTDLAAGFG
jgi:hypothetical protein